MAAGRTGRNAGHHHLGAGLVRAGQHPLLGLRPEVEPALYKAFNPWDEITTPPALAELFSRAGVPGATAEAVPGQHHLDHPDSFWDIVLGSGYRGTVDALRPDQRDQLREQLLGRLRSAGITTLRTDVVFGTAERPG